MLSRAFGIDLELPCEIAGLTATGACPNGPSTRVACVSAGEIEETWPDHDVVRLLSEVDEDAQSARTIDYHPVAGYRFSVPGFGAAVVSPDGLLVRCVTTGTPARRWQRLLVGRVLPWTSLIRGHEVFHASAVALEQRAVALVGPSGTGKTSLALQLVLNGARFVADDVLAVTRTPAGGLEAQPGPSLTGIRPEERARLTPRELASLGRLDTFDGKTYASLPTVSHGLPLGLMYLITRASPPSGESIQLLSSPDPSLLMASSFVLSLQSPQRLRNLLDVCADLVRDVPVFRVQIRLDIDAATLGGMLGRHAVSIL